MKSGTAPAITEVLNITEDSMPLEEPAVKAYQGVANIIAEEEVEENGTPFFPNKPVELRENFAETAFFYPALVTDEAGDVAFSFTMPESNTTWKLQLLAQTEDLKYGYLSREIITSKPLMVTPNLPRFLRQGDEVTITAQISNQSSATMDGRASLELFDMLEESTQLRDHLEETTAYYRKQLTDNGFDIIPGTHPCVPVMLYDEKLAGEFAKRMMAKGVYVVAFSFPVVPKGKARIRTQVCASHTREDIDFIVKCFKEVREEMGLS